MTDKDTTKKEKMAPKESADDLNFKDLLENANDIFQSVGPDGNFIYVNQAWCDTLGYTKEEAKKISFFDILEKECAGHCATLFSQIMQGESVSGIETTFVAKDGSKINVEGNCNCVIQDGKPVRTRGVFRNITARKKLEEQLVQAQKLDSLGTMAGGIAHEFNNLLMGIIGFTELILSEKSTSSSNRQYAKNIEKAAQRAAKLTNQILAYVGQGKFHMEILDIEGILKNVERIIRAALPENIILKILSCDNQQSYIKGDETSIRELIIQIVNNAAESLGEKKGLITISTGTLKADQALLDSPYFDYELPEGLYKYIKIEDTGSGMDKEQILKIFDPFYTTKFPGRGLGLATVQGIVKRHHGTIKVESVLKKGSVFTILLPAVKPETERSSTLLGELISLDKGKSKNSNKTIMVVDDEDVVREVARIMLEAAGYNVFIAEDGKKAVDIFREHRMAIDLIILDIIMPEMDGPEAFEHIRGMSTDVPVLISSGYSEDKIASKFLMRDIAGILHKPYREKKLIQTVGKILNTA